MEAADDVLSDVVVRAGEELEQVATGEHAHQRSLLVDHGEALQVVLVHHLRGIRCRRVGGDRHGGMAHDLAGHPATGSLPLVAPGVGPEMRMVLNLGVLPQDQIVLGNDTHQPAQAGRDRHRVEAPLGEEPRDLLDAGELIDRDHGRAHQLGDGAPWRRDHRGPAYPAIVFTTLSSHLKPRLERTSTTPSMAKTRATSRPMSLARSTSPVSVATPSSTLTSIPMVSIIMSRLMAPSMTSSRIAASVRRKILRTSPWLTMPLGRPSPSTTTRRFTPAFCIVRAACATGVSSATVIAGLVMSSPAKTFSAFAWRR